MEGKQGSPFPTREQEILLKAVLLDGDEAVKHWKNWSADWDVEGYLDSGSFRLLPLLYRNLSRMKVDDEKMMLLKGIYKQSWCKNMKLFNDSVEFLEILRSNNIPTLLLKGPSLTIQYYRDYGVRPMSDIDVLIPKNNAEDGIRILQEHGWKPEFPEYLEYNLRYGRSMMFYNSEGFEFDLHWYPFFESLINGSDAEFWANAIPLDFNGFGTLALCPTDNLLHTIIHGVKWNPEPPIRWIADAMAILRSEDQSVDWQRFTDMVDKFKVTLKIREAFNYLHQNFNAPIPQSVLSALNDSAVTFSEKKIYRYDKRNPDSIPDSFSGKLNHLFVVYLRQSGKRSIAGQITGFIKYLHFRTRGKKHLKILWYYLTRKQKKNA